MSGQGGESAQPRSGWAAAAVVLVAVGLLALADSAVAAPGWRPIVDVEDPPPALALSFPKVAARPGGCSTVAFERGSKVLASTRPPGASFSPVQDLGTILPAGYPEIAAGGGTAAAVWADSSSDVRIASAAACAPLGTPAEVPSTPSFPTDWDVAVDSNGTAIAVFGGGASGSRKAWVSQQPAGGSPSTAGFLSIPGGTEAFRPKVAANGAGDVGVAFDLTGNDVYGAVRETSGWSSPIRLNESGKPAVSDSLDIAVGPGGSVHALWIDAGATKLIFATLAADGLSVTRTTLHEVTTGSIAADPPSFPKLASGPEGRVAVVWVQVGTTLANRTVKAKVRAPDAGTFSGVLDVSPATSIPRGNPWLTIDRHGRGIATWSVSPTIGTQETMAAVLEPGSLDFSEEHPLTDGAVVASPTGISTDADGNTLAAVYSTGTPRAAHVAAFDAAGPILSGLSIPAGGVTGTPMPFSVSALDAWSPPGATSWAFGDGTSAIGPAVSHAYGAAGTFPVGVGATDALGNASTASGSVSIAAGPGAGAPELTDLKLSRKRFRVAGAGRARPSAKSPPVGTRATYRLSEAARVQFTVRQRGKRKALPGRGLTRRGQLSQTGQEGPNGFRFNGRFKGRRLAPARYTLTAVATDPDGNRSKPVSVAFSIVRG